MWRDLLSEYYGVIGFILIAGGFSYLVDHSPLKAHTLSRAMDHHRMTWMSQMVRREIRITDSQVISGLQNGIAFFASTALLGIGAAFTLLTALDSVMAAVRDIPALARGTRTQWEVMSLGLLVIYAYAFFKFGWAYRLINYAAILFGAVAHCSREAEPTSAMSEAADRAGLMNVAAGRQFNRGLRALFLSIGYLSWIAGPVAQISITMIVALILTYRQFFSPALQVLRADRDTLARHCGRTPDGG